MQFKCNSKQLKCNLDTTLMQSRYNLDATQMQCRCNLRKTKLNFDVSLAQFQPQLVFYFFSKSRFNHTYISLGNQYGFDLWWIWIWYVSVSNTYQIHIHHISNPYYLRNVLYQNELLCGSSAFSPNSDVILHLFHWNCIKYISNSYQLHILLSVSV